MYSVLLPQLAKYYSVLTWSLFQSSFLWLADPSAESNSLRFPGSGTAARFPPSPSSLPTKKGGDEQHRTRPTSANTHTKERESERLQKKCKIQRVRAKTGPVAKPGKPILWVCYYW
ncbi:uncharacterized protein PV07_10132 [Cladophialophora immunda]|uniref:Uncharacterized protein n=1 Tax=Cladophialophora immunda TaxID=569365 RepID=A0A0D2C1T8_9EURO|nr:uncharacterized protein PV07_10132 [Cladophialophora immunda]KIW24415.1 hypothetical protein PV07_10132 [Cladophialophora immunda]